MNRRRGHALAASIFVIPGLIGCESAPMSATPPVVVPSAGAAVAYSPSPAHVPRALPTPAPEDSIGPTPTRSGAPADRGAAAPAGHRTTIVVDIDETLCITDYNCVLWGIGSDDSRPLAHAAETLNELARSYDIIYLTARPSSVAHRSRAWLNRHGFPKGELIGSPSIGDFLGQTGFKKKTLARLKRERKGLLIGIGDKPTDAEAYRENGMLALVVNPWEGKRYHPRDLIFRDWRGIARFFEANEGILMDPLRLASSIRTGELPVMNPG